MKRVYCGIEPLGRFTENFVPWPCSRDVCILLDVPTGYALAAFSSVPKPYLIFTGNPCPLYLLDLLSLEPDGLIAPDSTLGLEEIERALAEVAAGNKVYIGPPLYEMSGLTTRERTVVQLLALGLDSQDIARRLVITKKTVQNITSEVLSKLNLRNRVELCYLYLGLFSAIEDNSLESLN